MYQGKVVKNQSLKFNYNFFLFYTHCFAAAREVFLKCRNLLCLEDWTFFLFKSNYISTFICKHQLDTLITITRSWNLEKLARKCSKQIKKSYLNIQLIFSRLNLTFKLKLKADIILSNQIYNFERRWMSNVNQIYLLKTANMEIM